MKQLANVGIIVAAILALMAAPCAWDTDPREVSPPGAISTSNVDVLDWNNNSLPGTSQTSAFSSN